MSKMKSLGLPPWLPLLACLSLTAWASCRSSSYSPNGPAVENPADPPSCLLVKKGYGPEGKVSVRQERVVSGLTVPWAIAFLPSGSMLVTERIGTLRLVKDGALVEEPVLSVPYPENGFVEGGLMGLALHPDFDETRLFYIAYTREKGAKWVNRIERWSLAENERHATLDEVILDDIPAHRFHNGGRLRIGPDRMLYVTTGDAGDPKRSQDPKSQGGKILRLDLDGGVPEDNPLEGNPLWLLGIRNSQGLDWLDDQTLALADHGPSGEFGRRGHDEVNVAKKGDNLGWPTIFGCETKDEEITPILTWEQAVPPGGLTIYRSDQIPEWRGSVMLATLGSRHLHRVVLDDERKVRAHELYFEGDPPKGLGRLRDATMGPDGHLYLTTSNCDGRGTCPESKDEIVRITPR